MSGYTRPSVSIFEAQRIADLIKARRAAEGTLGKPQPVSQPVAPVSKGAAR